MKRLLLGLAFNVLSFSLYAQQSGCNCKAVLEKLIKKVETEYPGFAVKTRGCIIIKKMIILFFYVYYYPSTVFS